MFTINQRLYFIDNKPYRVVGAVLCVVVYFVHVLKSSYILFPIITVYYRSNKLPLLRLINIIECLK